MATITFSSDVKSITSSSNSFGKSPVLAVKEGVTTIDSTSDAFTGTDPFVTIDGAGTDLTIKVAGLTRDGAEVTTNAEVISADSGAKVFWKNDDAYGADDLATFKALLDSADEVAIRLNADISTTKAEAIVVPAGKALTIDLNGHTIASTGADAILNQGTLTVRGAGKVTTSAKSSAAIATTPDSVTNLYGGDYTSGSWYVIKNTGAMTIDGDVNVLGTDGNVSSLIDNGWVSSSDTIGGTKYASQADKASLHIVNGQFDGKSGDKSCSVLKNDDNGVCVIENGTFDSTNNKGQDITTESGVNATTIINWNDLTINGGTFTGLYNISIGSAGDTVDKGIVTVNGGTFVASDEVGVLGHMGGSTTDGKLTINGGDFQAAINADVAKTYYGVVINGGTFVDDVSSALGDGATITQSDGKYVVISA